MIQILAGHCCFATLSFGPASHHRGRGRCLPAAAHSPAPEGQQFPAVVSATIPLPLSPLQDALPDVGSYSHPLALTLSTQPSAARPGPVHFLLSVSADSSLHAFRPNFGPLSAKKGPARQLDHALLFLTSSMGNRTPLHTTLCADLFSGHVFTPTMRTPFILYLFSWVGRLCI